MTRIAIIEDSVEVSNALASFCSKLGKDIIADQLYDRETAEKAIKETNYDLIVLDIELPPETNAGVGIIATNIKHHKSPVMVVSGLDPFLYRSIMKELDIWDYLEKPISPDGQEFVTSALRVLRAKSADAHANGSKTISMNNSTGKVSYLDRPLNLPQTAKLILVRLYEKKGTCVAYEDFFDLVKTGKNSDAIRQHIKTIREALADIGESKDHIAVIRMKGVQWLD